MKLISGAYVGSCSIPLKKMSNYNNVVIAQLMLLFVSCIIVNTVSAAVILTPTGGELNFIYIDNTTRFFPRDADNVTVPAAYGQFTGTSVPVLTLGEDPFITTLAKTSVFYAPSGLRVETSANAIGFVGELEGVFINGIDGEQVTISTMQESKVFGSLGFQIASPTVMQFEWIENKGWARMVIKNSSESEILNCSDFSLNGPACVLNGQSFLIGDSGVPEVVSPGKVNLQLSEGDYSLEFLSDSVDRRSAGPSPADFKFSLTSTIPVPATLWLFSSGLLGLIGIAQRKNRLKQFQVY